MTFEIVVENEAGDATILGTGEPFYLAGETDKKTDERKEPETMERWSLVLRLTLFFIAMVLVGGVFVIFLANNLKDYCEDTTPDAKCNERDELQAKGFGNHREGLSTQRQDGLPH